MRHRIALLESVRTPDEAGGASLSWSVVETVWAGLEHLGSAREAGGERVRRLKRIAATIRWRAGARLGGRVRFNGEDYDILSIASDDGRERRMRLVCEEVP